MLTQRGAVRPVAQWLDGWAAEKGEAIAHVALMPRIGVMSVGPGLGDGGLCREGGSSHAKVKEENDTVLSSFCNNTDW